MAIARWILLSRGSALARSSHCLAVAPTGRTILYGGELHPRTPVDAEQATKGAIRVFDVDATAKKNAGDSNAWKTFEAAGASVPEPRVGAAMSILGDYLYTWGGRGGVDMAPLTADEAGIWRTSLNNDSHTKWERVVAANEGEAPQPRSYHTMASLEDKLYIHAGCPAAGRVGELHSFDVNSKSWKQLATAPEPGRGGTVLALASFKKQNVLMRFAGFAGYELGADHAVDIYNIASDSWSTVTPTPDVEHGFPGPRSVHGFVGFKSAKQPTAVALLYHGERDASTLGHAGAGTFWNDVWMLEETGNDKNGLAWRYIPVQAEGPEARGWFPPASFVSDGETKVILQGGLLSSNQRSDELWLLAIDE